MVDFTNPTAPRKAWQSAVASLLLHGLLLALMAWLIRGVPAPGREEGLRPGAIVLADVDTWNDEIKYESQADQETPEVTAASPAEVLPTEPPPTTIAPAADQPPPALPVLDTGSFDASVMKDSVKAGGAGLEVSLSEEQLAAIRAEQLAMARKQAKGPAATTTVFGSGALTGRRFVIVLDRSKSMGSQGLGVLNRAKEELRQSLQALTAEHRFQIIAFHHQTATMLRREMLPATPENVELVGPFIDNLAPFGGTNYLGAFFAAMAMNPDVIIMLSDGDDPGLNAGEIEDIRRANRTAQIHAVQFGSAPQAPENSFLKKIAAENGGTYTYFNVNQWNPSKAP